MSQDAPMGHDITGTVYDIRGSIEEDDHADETYADDLTERMNLRVPEWMYWDIESVADTNGVKPSAAARELIERALGEWGPYAEFGNDDHTYGDCKCPPVCEHKPDFPQMDTRAGPPERSRGRLRRLWVQRRPDGFSTDGTA